MKALLVIFFGLFLVNFAAHAQYGYGSRNSGGPVTCAAFDNGWEEHWGGHASCSACLAVHGGCTEQCTQEETRCTAEGTLSSSRTETYYGTGASRWDAEAEAIRECHYNNASGCTIKDCSTEQNTVSSRSCR